MSEGGEKIRIILVDDQEMIRESLGYALQRLDDIEVVAQGQNGQEALALYREYQPDLALIDIVMPLMNGIDATAHICTEYPHAKVIALSSADDKTSIVSILKAGAKGYVLKHGPVRELVDAIYRVYQGETVLSSKVQKTLIDIATTDTKADYGLNERELKILALLVQGMSNPEIASRLYLSRSTIKVYVSSIFAKLGVANRGEAIAFALLHQLVAPPST